VEEANRRVRKGVPFREAYRMVAGEVGSGKFESTVISEYTHTGSIGNIGGGLIKTRLDQVTGGFSQGYSPEELCESLKKYL
jgi:argininosuccinate lyase